MPTNDWYGEEAPEEIIEAVDGGSAKVSSLETFESSTGDNVLSVNQLISSNFNGSFATDTDATKTINLLVVGEYLYLNQSNDTLSSTDGLQNYAAYLVESVSTDSGTTTVKVIMDSSTYDVIKPSTTTVAYRGLDVLSPGTSGWAISSDGDAVFNNITARGFINATSGYIGSSITGWTIDSDSLYYSTSSNNSLSSYDPSFENLSADEYWVATGTTSSGYFDFATYSTAGFAAFGEIYGAITVFNASTSTSISISSPALAMLKHGSLLTRFTRDDLGIPAGTTPTVSFSIHVRLATGLTGGTNATAYLVTNSGSSQQSETVSTSAWTKITVSRSLLLTENEFEFNIGVNATAISTNPYSTTPIFYVDGINFNKSGSTTNDTEAFESSNSLYLTANNTEPYPFKILDTNSDLVFGIGRAGSIKSSAASTFDIGGSFTQKAYDFTRFFINNSEKVRILPSYTLFGSSSVNTSSAPDTTQNSGFLISHNTGAVSAYYAGSDTRAHIAAFSNVGGTRNRKFMVDTTGTGYFDGAADAGNADYAEMFEWEDGNPNNEDRVGKTVVIVNGSKIRFATEQDSPDIIIGVVSAKPAFIGDTAWNNWYGKYVTDDFGRPINISEVPGEIVYQLSENYDDSLEYIPRKNRKEWSPVGMVGKLRVFKDEPKGSRWIKLKDISENIEEWLVR